MAVMFILANVLGVYVAYTAVKWAYRWFTAPLKHLPGPWHTRVCGAAAFTYGMIGQRSFWIEHLHQAYGPTVRITPTEADFMGPEDFKQIHHVSSKFVKDPWYTNVNILPRPTIFHARDPRDHAERRRLLAKDINLANLRKNFEPIVRDKCVLCIDKMKKYAMAADNKEIDILYWVRLLCTDVMGVVAFGRTFGTLELEKRSELIRILDVALLFGGFTAEMPWLRPIGSRLPFKLFKEGFNSVDFIMEETSIAVQSARNVDESAGPRSVLAGAVKEQQDNKEKGARQWDDVDIKVEALSLLIAGAGATATVIGFIWWQLFEMPELYKALSDEVMTLDPDFDDLKLASDCPLLNATMQEGMRLWAGVPSSMPRVSPPEGATLGGYFIPAGATCGTQAYSMHRDGNIFPDPLKFDPYRWSPGGNVHKDGRLLMSGFGAGAYSCLGPPLARMKARYMIAMLLREFPGIKVSKTQGPLVEKNLITWIALFPLKNTIFASFEDVQFKPGNNAIPGSRQEVPA